MSKKCPEGFKSGDRLRNIYKNMKSRCYDPKRDSYPNYGGKGVTVCESWLDNPINFYNDMVVGYSDDLTLDRIDSKGDYTPENCRWASWEEQANNKSNNVKISCLGKTGNQSQMCREFGVSLSVFTGRISRGWPVERALTEKVAYRSPIGEEFTILGRTGTIKELCTSFGVSDSTFRYRISKGWPMEKALTEISTSQESKSEMCRRHGISRSTFSSRISQGWSVDKALTEPVKHSTQETKVEMCRRHGINVSTFNKRIRMGWEVEKALSEPVKSGKKNT